MATRIVFFPTIAQSPYLYEEKVVEFDWVPGMSVSQGTKSVINLHKATKSIYGDIDVLEISSRSPTLEGIRLSAFNLSLESAGKSVSVESAYQSAKVFEFGGPYQDILSMSSLDAKRDSRLKKSGKLISFRFEDKEWPVAQSPNFYDYLYIRGLIGNSKKEILQTYRAFTDIAFSQTSLDYKKNKSFNCQARSAAIYLSLLERMPEENVLDFLSKMEHSDEVPTNQMELFE